MIHRNLMLLLTLLSFAASTEAIDTLRVTSPDPLLREWRWTEFDRRSGLAGRTSDYVYEDREGKGIPAEELPTIFDEYRQVKGSESSVQKGTGLGLSITKKFAERLGGIISVESEIDKGSIFTVRVPVKYQTP